MIKIFLFLFCSFLLASCTDTKDYCINQDKIEEVMIEEKGTTLIANYYIQKNTTDLDIATHVMCLKQKNKGKSHIQVQYFDNKKNTPSSKGIMSDDELKSKKYSYNKNEYSNLDRVIAINEKGESIEWSAKYFSLLLK